MTQHILHKPDNTTLEVIVCLDTTNAVGVTSGDIITFCPFCSVNLKNNIKVVEGEYGR